MPSTTSDGKDGSSSIKLADLHATVLGGLVGIGERCAPKSTRRALGRTALEIIGVVEWSRAGKKDGGAAWMEGSVGEREGRDVQGLEVWIRVPVNLWKHFNGCETGEVQEHEHCTDAIVDPSS